MYVGKTEAGSNVKFNNHLKDIKKCDAVLAYKHF